MKFEIIAKTKILNNSTGIGTIKGTDPSLKWDRIKQTALRLIEEGEIEIKNKENGDERVDFKDKWTYEVRKS